MQSTVSVSSCADTNYMEPDAITPEWPICTGYLDPTLAIFRRHKHPFVLISTLALRWSGADNLNQDEIVRSSEADAIVQDLVTSGEWKLSKNDADTEGDNFKPSMINCSQTRDIWLWKPASKTLGCTISDSGQKSCTNSRSIAEKSECPMYKTNELCWLKMNIFRSPLPLWTIQRG